MINKRISRETIVILLSVFMLASCGNTGAAVDNPAQNVDTVADVTEEAADNAIEAPSESVIYVEEESIASEETEDESTPIEENSTEASSLEEAENKESTAYTYMEGFTKDYISDEIKQRINGLSYKEDCVVPYEDLRYLCVKYVDFEGNDKNGEIICNAAIADDLLEIFYELYKARYEIDKIRLVDEYGADDDLSCADDNSSCFNFRTVAGSSNLSKHALGLAIDINPFYNPYVTYPNGNIRITPEGAEIYADRSADFPHKIDKNDLAYKEFTAHGFTWGGNWKSLKDYQHFQKDVSYSPSKASTEEAESFYQKLKQGKPVNILVNGDSIASGGGASEGKSWAELLKSYITKEYGSACTMNNISMGGNGSYAGYVRENMLDGTEYDLAVLCYGQNDDGKTISRDYEAIIRTTQKKYKACSMIAVLESSQKKYTKKIKSIQELAGYYGIPVADTIAAFNKSGKSYDELTVDDKHPNDVGYELYFEELKKLIEAGTRENAAFRKAEKEPLNKDVTEYDSIAVFPADVFKRENKLTWKMDTDRKITGTVGIYHTFYPGKGYLKISFDGADYLKKPLDWGYDFSQDYIYKTGDKKYAASEHIEVSFSSEELADGFKGLIFTGG